MKKVFAILIVTALALATLFLYAYRSQVYAELDALKLIPQPERFTEIYLNDSTALPKTVSKGDIVTFAFTIHNLEGKTMEYPYSVFMQLSDGSRISIDMASTSLADNASTSIAESYTFKTTPKSPVEVFITLLQQNQSLHFVLPSRE